MKINNLLFLVVVFITTLSFSQEMTLVENQNPNFKESLDKYKQIDYSYVLAEGTTLQETYVAIDPLEEKRKRRSLKRQYRANRLLWRHQERMELAKNGIPYEYDNGYYNNYGNSNWFGSQNLLDVAGLGLLSYCLFR